MIKAFTVSVLSLFFFSSVQIAFINENTEGYLEKAGLLKLTRDICIKKGDCPGKHGTNGNPTLCVHGIVLKLINHIKQFYIYLF
jgi:hypothetical protein